MLIDSLHLLLVASSHSASVMYSSENTGMVQSTKYDSLGDYPKFSIQ